MEGKFAQDRLGYYTQILGKNGLLDFSNCRISFDKYGPTSGELYADLGNLKDTGEALEHDKIIELTDSGKAWIKSEFISYPSLCERLNRVGITLSLLRTKSNRELYRICFS